MALLHGGAAGRAVFFFPHPGRDADAFLKARFPEQKDYNEITSMYDRQVSVNQDVYFEIGLIVGGKIAFEISKRMEELK